MDWPGCQPDQNRSRGLRKVGWTCWHLRCQTSPLHQQEHAGERSNHTRRMGYTCRDNKTTRVKKTTKTDTPKHMSGNACMTNARLDTTPQDRVACLDTCKENACLRHASHVWKRMSGKRMSSTNMRFRTRRSLRGPPRRLVPHQPIRCDETRNWPWLANECPIYFY